MDKCSRCGREKPLFLLRAAANDDKVCPICIRDGRGDDVKDAPAIEAAPERVHDGISYL